MKYKVIIGFCISAVCILFAFYRVDFGELLASLTKADLLPLCVAVLLILLTQVIRSFRWKLLLASIKVIRVASLLSATSIGAMADMIFPARMGDILRASIIGNKEKFSKLSSLATIVTERVFDVFTILVIWLLVVLFYKLPVPAAGSMSAIRTAGAIASAICLLVMGALVVLKTRLDTITRLFNTLFAFFPDRWRVKLSESMASFALGLQSIQFSWHLAIILLYSILLWTAFAFSNFFVLRALHFNYHPATAYFILLFQVLGVTLPSSPGFIGTYHAAVVAGLSAFDISFEQALSVAIVMHAAFFFPFIAFGLLFLWKENMSFSHIRSMN
ncbi:MAG: lysylphosphatidylglycerol synthase transmembrane domain-containing protein [Thermodesulfobacteriota bacterium]|nr:lysylphosphatidylglycerol synthase transmembrane domain-containing protein [Thermodesulfobacteriota bacterium]